MGKTYQSVICLNVKLLQTITANTVPSVTANITSDEIPSVLGRRYTFTCYVSGAEKLNPMTKYDWKKNISGAAQLPVGTNSSVLLLPSLKLSDAGQYSCHITIQSHYLDNELTAVASQNVLLECKLS